MAALEVSVLTVVRPQRVEDILREQGVDPATQPISIYLTGKE